MFPLSVSRLWRVRLELPSASPLGTPLQDQIFLAQALELETINLDEDQARLVLSVERAMRRRAEQAEIAALRAEIREKGTPNA